MIRPLVPGLQPVASTQGGYSIPQLSCSTARCSWQGDLIPVQSHSPVPNFTIPPRGPGQQPAASTPRDTTIRQLSLATARCSLPGETPMNSIVPNFTIRRPAPGQ